MGTLASKLMADQFGRESVPGTPVAGNKKYPNLAFMFSRKRAVKSFKPQGERATSASVAGREYSEGTVKGPADYNEFMYLASMIKAETAGGQFGTSGAYAYTVAPANSTLDTPKTQSHEWGDGQSGKAYKVNYVACTGLNCKIDKDSWEWDGKLIGRKRTRGQTLTASPVKIVQSVVQPTTIGLYFSVVSWTDLDTATASTALYTLEISTDGWWAPNTPVDSAQPSFTELLPGDLKATAKVTVKAESTEDVALTAALENSTPVWIRAKALGDLIGTDTGTDYHKTMQVTIAATVSKEPAEAEVDGAKAYTYELELHGDPGHSNEFIEYYAVLALATL